MKRLKQLFCKHRSYTVIYRNQGVSRDLKFIKKYEIRVCKKCRKRIRKQIKDSYALDEYNSFEL